jgi:hypothetical protein
MKEKSLLKGRARGFRRPRARWLVSRSPIVLVSDSLRVERLKSFAVHRSPFTVHRSRFTVHRSPFTVHRSPFTVRGSPFGVRRSLVHPHMLGIFGLMLFERGVSVSLLSRDQHLAYLKARARARKRYWRSACARAKKILIPRQR